MVHGVQSLHLHTLSVEPAGVAGRTLEDGVAEQRLDGVQADGAGLRQTELRTHTQRLSGTVIAAERPGHKHSSFTGAVWRHCD